MSADYVESDSELNALRNELLNGLDKIKRNSADAKLIEKSFNQNDHYKEDEEDELEILRLEALNAKRKKTKIVSNVLPGRFRYDKDSGEDEDDDEEEEELEQNILSNNKYKLKDLEEETNNYLLVGNKPGPIEYDPCNTNGENLSYNCKDNYNKQLKQINSNRASSYVNNFYSHRNYLTYRNECSKLMSNDAYDPQSIASNGTLPLEFDLRNYLRDKALRQQEQLELENNDFISENPNAIVYSEPITKPIEISSELFDHKYRGGPYSSRFNNSYDNYNKRRAFVNGTSGEVRNDNDKMGLINENKTSFEKNKESENETCVDDDSEDELYLSGKKLKSVVTKAIISNEDKSGEIHGSNHKDSSMTRDRNSYLRISSKRK